MILSFKKGLINPRTTDMEAGVNIPPMMEDHSGEAERRNTGREERGTTGEGLEPRKRKENAPTGEGEGRPPKRLSRADQMAQEVIATAAREKSEREERAMAQRTRSQTVEETVQEGSGTSSETSTGGERLAGCRAPASSTVTMPMVEDVGGEVSPTTDEGERRTTKRVWTAREIAQRARAIYVQSTCTKGSSEKFKGMPEESWPRKGKVNALGNYGWELKEIPKFRAKSSTWDRRNGDRGLGQH
jgi:hypothetical protein